MTHLELRRLTKHLGSIIAVDDLSLQAAPGELLTLVGPSGCGKTTTLRLIAGFEQPDSGDILINEQSIVHLPPEERGVGIVFQNYALFPHMNVCDNVAYGLRFAKPVADRTQRVRDLLRLVDLQGLEKRRPAELSAGQQQRAALARALAPQPKVLLLDEPLSALDAQLRERLRHQIKQIQRAFQITTIYVTHDQAEALAISDRVAVINDGHLEQVGRPAEIYHQPATRFVAEFVGHGNLLEGHVVSCYEKELCVQMSDAQQFIVGPSADTTPGSRIQCLVRPEKLKIDGSAENRIELVSRGFEFLGDGILIHGEACGQRWLVKTTEDQVPSEGSTFTVSFSVDDVWVIPQVDHA